MFVVFNSCMEVMKTRLKKPLRQAVHIETKLQQKSLQISFANKRLRIQKQEVCFVRDVMAGG